MRLVFKKEGATIVFYFEESEETYWRYYFYNLGWSYSTGDYGKKEVDEK